MILTSIYKKFCLCRYDTKKCTTGLELSANVRDNYLYFNIHVTSSYCILCVFLSHVTIAPLCRVGYDVDSMESSPNVSVWFIRLSVRPSLYLFHLCFLNVNRTRGVLAHTQRDSPDGSTRRGQHTCQFQ